MYLCFISHQVVHKSERVDIDSGHEHSRHWQWVCGSKSMNRIIDQHLIRLELLCIRYAKVYAKNFVSFEVLVIVIDLLKSFV